MGEKLGEPVLCSRNITVVPDRSLADALAETPSYDAVSGLEGSERFCKSEVVGAVLKQHESSGKIIAAICAGKRITSYPGTKDKITPDYTYVEGERVVIDGNVVTSR
ncbi:DJ-1 beta, partial [Operophtera brumata]